MKLRLAAQLAVPVAVPVVALACTLAAVSLLFGHLHSLQAETLAKREVTRHVHDMELRVWQLRYAVVRYGAGARSALDIFDRADTAEKADLVGLHGVVSDEPDLALLLDDAATHVTSLTRRLRGTLTVIAHEQTLAPTSAEYRAIERARAQPSSDRRRHRRHRRRYQPAFGSHRHRRDPCAGALRDAVAADRRRPDRVRRVRAARDDRHRDALDPPHHDPAGTRRARAA
jgi:hypothetical protein